ncbi:MAG: 30S ribosomal protein S12 methylthiotransferase RimO, partial [Propionibacteriaceae bacterium]|nr:30S ribosomal protein S12 methylthiotransferase RimO [Propionibacteriaceae bacterium]
MTKPAPKPHAFFTTLGCARNETDSEHLAGRIAADGFEVTDDPATADLIIVNTCGFIEPAKKDSIDALLAASSDGKPGAKVVAVGCLAQRYGAELDEALPEVDAVLGFATYPAIGDHLREVLGGGRPQAALSAQTMDDGPRRRLDAGPYAPLKIASGCDRRCAFCAIPAIRGPFQSRPASDIVAEARWLVSQGVREVMLVSENSSSYGKDLGQTRALEALLGSLAGVDGLDWVRVSYLQPAEIRPSLLETMASTGNVVPYFDLSFQHASGPLLRRMRRFGDGDAFLDLLQQVRALSPQAGVRSSAIVGFPGETEEDVATLHAFLEAARPDAIGVFAYSDEEGTLAHKMDGHLPRDVIDARCSATLDLATWVTEARAAERIGEQVQVLVESIDDGVAGRAAQQGPEVDGVTTLTWPTGAAMPKVGDIVWAKVTATEGVDL